MCMKKPLKKKDACVCPNCHNEDTIQCNTEMYFEEGGVLFSVEWYCDECEETFSDHFFGKYDGYTDRTGVYNKDGVRVSD